MNYTAPIIADDIHEESEGFFVRIQLSFTDTGDADVFVRERDGFAFVRIVNDDCEYLLLSQSKCDCPTLLYIAIMFGFEMEVFTLEEDSGDTSVVFGKVNNDMTEVSLDVIIDFDIQTDGLMEGHCSSTVTNMSPMCIFVTAVNWLHSMFSWLCRVK